MKGSNTDFSTENDLWRYVRVGAAFAIALMSAACATAPNRPEQSSYGCMVAVRDSAPSGLPDKREHCVVSAWIAQRCSLPEAYLAGAGKELMDLVTGGDAEWADWRADRAGIACSKHQASIQAIDTCCMEHGY